VAADSGVAIPFQVAMIPPRWATEVVVEVTHRVTIKMEKTTKYEEEK
jgi:hypothetical protein